MRILYGIQDTGNGHLAKSREIVSRLLAGAEVDVLISGTQYEIALPLRVAYQYPGIGFAFGRTGGIDYWNSLRRFRVLRSAQDMLALPRRYDLVVSDFEPISAYFAKWRGPPSVAVSHQAAVLQPGAPLPERREPVAEWIMRWYVPCQRAVGLHFLRYAPNIVEPVIHREEEKVRLSGVFSPCWGSSAPPRSSGARRPSRPWCAWGVASGSIIQWMIG